MAATTCAPVLMPRWVNTNVYPSKHSLDFSFLAYLGSCFEYFFFLTFQFIQYLSN